MRIAETDPRDAADLAAEIRQLSPGEKVDVLIERDGGQKTVSVTLGTRPTNQG